MIRINKPSLDKMPSISKALKIKLKKKTAELKKEYLAYRSDYDDGEKKFSIDTDLYKGGKKREIKEALFVIQNHKCCFCEQKINAYVDVEHFRPKQAYKKSLGDKENYPSYYWLAYDWDNLFLACEVCNSAYKGSLFPLIDENTRAKNHLYSLTTEKPLLIHPSHEKPKDFITFKGFQAIGKNGRGRAVIEFFSLNKNRLNKDGNYQDNLRDEREKYFKLAESVAKMASLSPSEQISQEEINEAKNLLNKLKKEKFAAMIRANF
jgi:uncharacterized protein (TIGR02646 family)